VRERERRNLLATNRVSHVLLPPSPQVERATFFECEGSEAIGWARDVLRSIVSDIASIKNVCTLIVALRILSEDVSEALAAADDTHIVKLTTRVERLEASYEEVDPAVSWCKTALAAGELIASVKEMLGKILE